MSKKAINIVLFVLGGLPLLIYPAMVIANIMQLGAMSYLNDGMIKLVGYLYILFSSTYIFTYIICLVIFLAYRIKDRLIFSIIPIIQAVSSIILFLLWYNEVS